MQIIPDPIFTAVMLVPFFFTYAVLSALLVKPMRLYLEGRDAAITGARKEALALEAQVEDKLSDLETRLVAARKQAAGVRAEHRERGMAAERERIDAARAQAEGQISAALGEIATERDAARGSLEGMAKAISVDIAGRVLGRSIQA